MGKKTFRVITNNGKPLRCSVCGRFYNWTIEREIKGIFLFKCSHEKFEDDLIHEIPLGDEVVSIENPWYEEVLRFSIFDADGKGILCDICGRNENWVYEKYDPESLEKAERYVCEHAICCSGFFKIFRMIRPVNRRKVFKEERR
jgi:hypothetical protein